MPIVITILITFLILLLIGSNSEVKDTEIDKSRYVQIFADPEERCEYFTTKDGGMYPRLLKDGTQRGCK